MQEYTPDSTPTKQCKRCQERKPANTENYHADKKRRDGFYYYCKACVKTYQEQRRASRSPIERTEKHCPHCDIMKPIEFFYADSYKPDGRENICKACRSARRGVIYRTPPPPTPDGYKWCRKCNQSKPLSAFHKKSRAADGLRAICTDCRTRHEDYLLFAKHRREKKANSENHYTRADVENQYASQSGRCYYCNCELNGKYQTDHVIPLSRGGSDGPENIVVACEPCNRSKGAKLPHEWPQGNRLL